ncbi:MAG: DHH family phosphoesterase [Hydrococcus sp. C42_A2020_068]|nr:DHH family phosphoesterase [Hydrococcus sp. C42_A2020_068]
MLQPQWQISPLQEIPTWFIEAVRFYTPSSDGKYAAQILWQRGIREHQQLIEFLDPNAYRPTSPFAFGQEMKRAIQRLLNAREKGEKVTIWGDFDADGITATSVLWEGLGEFFTQHQQLSYYIPNRLTESHGLNCPGIDKLAASGTKLIVTCDTGSTNLNEIVYANQLGIDIIITDHHTLLEERPPVISIINPRYFAKTHPLFHLSGVAVAYKLVEALYQTLPDIPQQPVEELLDLVAIGLIADLVQLSGDCRYLAQRGIQKLQERSSSGKNQKPTRPGVAFLLEFCQKNGDRPTDISFGLGPRINAVSRIHGEASFCVELLTSRDAKRCKQLAEAAELANARRKALQKDVTEQVKKQLSRIDLSTTSVIVLEDSQWQSGVLGLVAGQIAQEYNRPTILLSVAENEERETERQGDKGELIQNPPFSLKRFEERAAASPKSKIARGSARSANNINLYELVESQAHLLHRFGGHPFAAGLSLLAENIPLFREAIDCQLRQKYTDLALKQPIIQADLIVTVSELGKSLFRELKLIEPYGMGNPAPKLLIKNCWFENVWHQNTQDFRGKKIPYIKTTFKIWDDSSSNGFPGMWWGHYKDEIPLEQRCDAIVELDFNPYKKHYEVRLINIRQSISLTEFKSNCAEDSLFDLRNSKNSCELRISNSPFKPIEDCPTSWNEIQKEYRIAIAQKEKLALAYQAPQTIDPHQIWQQLIGIAKYLNRTGKTITLKQLQDKLELSNRTLALGLEALSQLGFKCQKHDGLVQIHYCYSEISQEIEITITRFIETVKEEQFQRQYFYQISLSTLQENLICY